MWDEITYALPNNYSGCTVEVWEWIGYFIPHCIMHQLLIDAAWIKVKTVLVNGAIRVINRYAVISWQIEIPTGWTCCKGMVYVTWSDANSGLPNV